MRGIQGVVGGGGDEWYIRLTQGLPPVVIVLRDWLQGCFGHSGTGTVPRTTVGFGGFKGLVSGIMKRSLHMGNQAVFGLMVFLVRLGKLRHGKPVEKQMKLRSAMTWKLGVFAGLL